MNFISFMMISHGLNDSIHDGYTWPVQNPKLKCYVDANCDNADPQKEFLKEIIEEAGDMGFHVNLFMNGFWWNPDKVKKGYPNIRTMNSSEDSLCYHHCADNEDTWKLACEEVADLLGYYSHPAVKSYGFETIGRGGCSCPDTMKMFAEDQKTAGVAAKECAQSRQEMFRLWNGMRDKQVMEKFVLFIKKLKQSVAIWHHGYMELGNYGGYRFSPHSYRKADVDVAMPCIHTVTDEDMLKNVLESSEDFPLVLHVDTRNSATLNYSIPLKTPEYILHMGEWIAKYNRKNLIGVVFFNEVATSRENRQAVYDVLKRWRKDGLCQKN